MKAKAVVSIGIFLVVSSISLMADATDLSKYIPGPGDKNQWQLEGTAKQAKGNELFMLINGGATLYLQFGFNQAVIVTVKNKNGQPLNLDIYEMNSAEAAKQVNREKIGKAAEKVDIGTEAYLEEYYINFYQEQYQVTISGFDDSNTSRESIIALAQLVSRKISGTK